MFIIQKTKIINDLDDMIKKYFDKIIGENTYLNIIIIRYYKILYR
jgi:hypothetical protein